MVRDPTICPTCHYPLLKLKDFEGISSRDAPDYGSKDLHDYSFWGAWAIAHDILQGIWHGISLAWRKRKVRKLQAEILPRFPNSLICPQCLSVVRKT